MVNKWVPFPAALVTPVTFDLLVDLLLDRINTEKVAFDESLAGSRQPCPTCLSLPHCRMATEELATISSQLHSQAKVTPECR